MLRGYVEAIESEGWTVERLQRYDKTESVILCVGGLPPPLETIVVVLGPGTPSVPAFLYLGPPGPPEHRGEDFGLLCLPQSAGHPVERLRAAIALYQVEHEDFGMWAAIGHAAPEPRTNRIQRHGSHSALLACRVPQASWGTFVFAGSAVSWRLSGWIERTTAHANRASVSLADRVLVRNLEAAHGRVDRCAGVWLRIEDREYPLAARALWSRWKSTLPAGASNVQAMLDAVEEFPHGLLGQRLPQVRLFGLVVPEEGPGRGEWGDRFLLLVVRGDQGTVVPVEDLASAFGRLPDLEMLRNKTVCVAGLGMLGSPVAEWLARSGMGSLRLLDAGTVKAGNLVRQSYDVSDIGSPKAAALRRRLSRQAPWCQIRGDDVVASSLASMTRKELARWMSGADLVIVALADRDATLYLADVAADLGMPLIAGWATFGVWGGICYVTRWGETGCPGCMEHDQSLEEASAPVDGGAELWLPGCADPTFPGHAADGAVISSVMTRLAFHELAKHDPEPPGSHATVELRTDDASRGPNISWNRFTPHADCRLCARWR